MPRSVHARIDREMDLAIEKFATENGLARSQAIRDLLRQALWDPKPVERGFREGLVLGQQEVLRGIAAGAKRG